MANKLKGEKHFEIIVTVGLSVCWKSKGAQIPAPGRPGG
jgi:hypothetical protein